MPVETLLNVLADHAAEVDEIAEDRAAAWFEREQRLLDVPEERDEDMWGDAWERMDLDESWLDFDLGEMLAIPIADRSLMWPLIMQAMIAVAKWQASMDVGHAEALTMASLRHATETELHAKSLSTGDLKNAARLGISQDRVTAAKGVRLATRQLG